MKNRRIRLLSVALMLLLALLMTAGCSETRENLVYTPAGGAQRLEGPVTGALIPLVDVREQAKVYPKQVIMYTDYSGNVSYDINDRTVADVLNDALSRDLSDMGVKLVQTGVSGPLDRDSAAGIRSKIAASYPDVKVAFGGRIKEFMAKSVRKTLTTDVHVSAALQFYILDMQSGDVYWSDYKTEWNDVKASVDHNYMIEQLDQAIANLMKNVRDNQSMRDLLKKKAS